MKKNEIMKKIIIMKINPKSKPNTNSPPKKERKKIIILGEREQLRNVNKTKLNGRRKRGRGSKGEGERSA